MNVNAITYRIPNFSFWILSLIFLSSISFSETQAQIVIDANDLVGIDRLSCGPGQEISIGSSCDPEFEYIWTSTPSDPSLFGEENESSPNVSPISSTSYMLNIVPIDPNIASCNPCQAVVNVIVIQNFTLTAENNITECMERRSIEYSTNLLANIPPSFDGNFTYRFDYMDEDKNLTHMVTMDDHFVASTPWVGVDPSHHFSMPVIATIQLNGDECTNTNSFNMEVYELWIDHVRHSNSGLDWQVVVGDAPATLDFEPIEYEAVAANNCFSWLWDMEDGAPQVWNPNGGLFQTDLGGNPMHIFNTDLPVDIDWDQFGSVNGTTSVECEDGEGRFHKVYLRNPPGGTIDPSPGALLPSIMNVMPNLDVQVFFLKDDTSNPGGVNPNWFYYWKEFIPMGNITTLIYDPAYPPLDYGETDPILAEVIVGPRAGRDNDETMHNGLHTFYEVIAHENHHIVLWNGWWGAGGASVPALDTDGDDYPDAFELTAPAVGFGFVVGVDDSYSTGMPQPGTGNSAGYDYEEFHCRAVEHAVVETAFDNNDWSYDPTGVNQGKQW